MATLPLVSTVAATPYIRIEAAPIVKSTGEPRPPEHDANGVRKYHPDPHHQSTGRYLGAWPLPN